MGDGPWTWAVAGKSEKRRFAGATVWRLNRGELARLWSETLGAEIFRRLHQLDLIAAGECGRSAAEVAQIRIEMRTMIATWRRLLDRHRATDDGHCPRCRTWWGRRRWWPCPVWTEAHYRLMVQYPRLTES